MILLTNALRGLTRRRCDAAHCIRLSSLAFSKRFLAALMVSLGLVFVPLHAMAQTSAIGTNLGVSEDWVKAVSLYKFLNYVEWPASSFEKADSPYVIGVLDADAVASELTKIAAGHTVNNRTVTVKSLQASDSFAGIHVLFIGKGMWAKQPLLLKRLQQQPVLLVTETDGALEQGSMINFRMVDNHIRFEVALPPIEKSGLILNTRMLAVAISVIKGTP